MSSHCLNCGNAVSAVYCEKCGQKTSTHRFSLKHIFSHDFVHGVFHLDKGFFYTTKELLVRPGHSIREFIDGKRVRHFNYFTLILLILTIDLLLKGLSPVNVTEIYDSVREEKAVVTLMDKLTKEYPKLFVLCTIPVYAVFSSLIFRKAKRNFAEHLVLNSYRAAGEILIGLSMTVMMIFLHDVQALKIIISLYGFIGVGYAMVFFYQFFSVNHYSRKGLVFRSFLSAISIPVLIIIGTVVYIIVVKP